MFYPTNLVNIQVGLIFVISKKIANKYFHTDIWQDRIKTPGHVKYNRIFAKSCSCLNSWI